MNEQNDLAQAIVSIHRARLGLPLAQAVHFEYSNDQLVYRCAKQACLTLGFIAIDAEVLAQAWQASVARTGQFSPKDWPAHPADFGMSAWPRSQAFAPCPRQLGLYAVLPDAAWVGRMAKAGVPTVQLRFKSDDARAVQSEIRSAVAAVQGTSSLLFINDHWQAAIVAGAYGVHLGQEDLAQADMQSIRSAGLRLGLSSHGYAEMLYADSFSPSYIAMGAVFPTTLKRMATAAQGTGRLTAYATLMRDYPLVAIGGIDAGSMKEVLASGVGSIAVVRALVAAGQPEIVATEFQAQMQMLLALGP